MAGWGAALAAGGLWTSGGGVVPMGLEWGNRLASAAVDCLEGPICDDGCEIGPGCQGAGKRLPLASNRRYERRLGVSTFALSCATVVAILLGATSNASASFPGSNGALVFVREGTDRGIYTY